MIDKRIYSRLFMREEMFRIYSVRMANDKEVVTYEHNAYQGRSRRS